MPKVYAIDGLTPVVDPSAFVHPGAVLIAGANVQDACLLHGFPGKDTVVGAEASVGHGAVLHGCVVRRGALVGMNSVINDNADIGEDAMVAALAFVRARRLDIPGSFPLSELKKRHG